MELLSRLLVLPRLVQGRPMEGVELRVPFKGRTGLFVEGQGLGEATLDGVGHRLLVGLAGVEVLTILGNRLKAGAFTMLIHGSQVFSRHPGLPPTGGFLSDPVHDPVQDPGPGEMAPGPGTRPCSVDGAYQVVGHQSQVLRSWPFIVNEDW